MLYWKYSTWLWRGVGLFVAGLILLAISLGIGAAQAENIRLAHTYGREDPSNVLPVLVFLLGLIRQLCNAGAGVCVVFGAVRFGFELAFELKKSGGIHATEQKPRPTEPS